MAAQFGSQVLPLAWGRCRQHVAARILAGEHHVARHDVSQPLIIDLDFLLPDPAVVADLVYAVRSTRRCSPAPDRGASAPLMVSACCCIRPCVASSSGSGSAPM